MSACSCPVSISVAFSSSQVLPKDQLNESSIKIEVPLPTSPHFLLNHPREDATPFLSLNYVLWLLSTSCLQWFFYWMELNKPFLSNSHMTSMIHPVLKAPFYSQLLVYPHQSVLCQSKVSPVLLSFLVHTYTLHFSLCWSWWLPRVSTAPHTHLPWSNWIAHPPTLNQVFVFFCCCCWTALISFVPLETRPGLKLTL